MTFNNKNIKFRSKTSKTPILMYKTLQYTTEQYYNAKYLAKIVRDYLPANPQEIEYQVDTNFMYGLSLDNIIKNYYLFGKNIIYERPPTPFYKIYFETFTDPTLIILLISSIVSIVVGAAVPEERKEQGYIDGIAIIVAVIVVSLVGSVNDYYKEKQFYELNKKKDEVDVYVIRGGKEESISVHELTVGDILIINQGLHVPVDCLLVSAQEIKMDQSQMTGETAAVLKNKQKPHILSGSLVEEGSGRAVVTAVGPLSAYGEMLEAMKEDVELETPLQVKLNALVKLIGYVGMGAAALTLIALISEFFAKGLNSDKNNYTYWISYVILAITIVVVAIPEGLPLAVTISLAYSMKKMIKDNCWVRKLECCETCGSVSVICSDKTGTLTANEMRIVSIFTPGISSEYVSLLQYNKYTELIAFNGSLTSNCRLDGEKVIGLRTAGSFLLFTKNYLRMDYQQIRSGLNGNNTMDKAKVAEIDYRSERKRESILIDMQEYVVPECINYYLFEAWETICLIPYGSPKDSATNVQRIYDTAR